MALVAYDYGSSEEEEEENSPSSVIIPKETDTQKTNGQQISEPNSTNILEDNISDDEIDTDVITTKNDQTGSKSLFSVLPETKTVAKEIIEDKIEDFIPKPSIPPKKERQKVKISIPSLSQFQDDDEPEVKRIKPSMKGSGLIGLLPPVKGAVKSNISFVPNVIANKNKPVASSSTSALTPSSVKKNADLKKAAVLKKQKEKAKIVLSDAESDDDLDVPETYDDEMWEKVCGRPKPKPVIQVEEEPQLEEVINIAPEPAKPYDGLDNQAFKELIGKSRRPIGNIKLIDINEEEILADKDLWMAKSLTDPEMAPRSAVEDPVDPTRRKKHHITYLAQQAKANEQELQSQWAASKNNKYASRAKYGF
ncbi:uncharacterized protein LOC126890892 [Diabrotica virgifera virgifera]|uniref:Uncharacterized protein LOC114337929 n=1 Tax=Diabrotica virgifera virgifera TaxID=50390 RepID=A0A6P7G5J1_DIAVI|nr:uncharacterized protein LOC126890892 [Diabrotica virgifera virgifera]XP_050516006.1 uncharacterized protein LOC126890892 [Diabrotica virgifera virgifera]XP_050516007.1 uncharacterized protein LOC126890892 [Diabrotica virgifera virgifera]